MNFSDYMVIYNVLNSVSSLSSKWTVGDYAFAIVPELIQFIFLLAFSIGMFQGIEIGHPVFHCLFVKVVAGLVVSVVNLVLVIPLHFDVWALVSCCLNLSYITFHNCSWAALSALRFFYIARKDWLLQQFTERQIIYILLSIISGLVIICYSTFFGVLTYANYSYMWPDKSFLSELRPQEKSKASFLFLISFWYPIIISCIFYAVLLVSLKKKTLSVQAEKFSEISLEEPDDMFGVPEMNMLEDAINFKAREKMNRERQAVLRALISNLLFVLWYLMPSLMLKYSPATNYTIHFFISTNKLVLPIFVNVINFEIVRELATKYWQNVIPYCLKKNY